MPEAMQTALEPSTLSSDIKRMLDTKDSAPLWSPEPTGISFRRQFP